MESWNEDVSKDVLDTITELIAKDGYEVEGFELLEIPHPKVFCFGNCTTKQFFDVVKFWGDEWKFSYTTISERGPQNEFAHSIQEAIEKYEFY